MFMKPPDLNTKTRKPLFCALQSSAPPLNAETEDLQPIVLRIFRAIAFWPRFCNQILCCAPFAVTTCP